MPVTYQIDACRGLIQTRCVGAVSLADVQQHFRQLALDPRLPDRPDVLLDLLDLTSVPQSDQLRAVAADIQSLASSIRWGAFAVVADRDVLFGMSRMLEAFTSDAFGASRVFRSRHEAMDWLSAQRAQGPARAG